MYIRCIKEKCLKDDEWTRWLHWMRNCFRYGTLGEYWKQTESENWYDPSFQEFVNKELIPGTQKNDGAPNLDNMR